MHDARNCQGDPAQSGWIQRAIVLTAVLTVLVCSSAGYALGATPEADPMPESEVLAVAAAPPGAVQESQPEAWSVHGQFTNVTQWHPRFKADYSGPNSLDAKSRNEETSDATLFAGLRLWDGTEFWLNPEVDQGFGLSDTLGVAGYPSGEAYKIGANVPYLRIPRAFIRHVIRLGDGEEKVESGANQLAGVRPTENVTLTIGKFSVVDLFDTNAYAHDPRADFLNWSVIDAGAFDYAADSWGFTYGAALEWTEGWWTLRSGIFQLSKVPNSKVTGVRFGQHMLVAELETRYQWQAHPGKLKFLGFVNRGKMGSYGDAVRLAQQTGDAPDTALVRTTQTRPGFAVNLEQEVSSALGVFARASVNDGGKEAFEFTEINRSISAGASLRGNHWGRPDDTLGLAMVVNAISSDARKYFSAGGLGILIGDGQLTYGPEKIVEAYYSLHAAAHLVLALDYQHIVNPAYNRDRGPVSIYGGRVHLEF